MKLATKLLSMYEANNNWAKGIVFGNTLSKEEAQGLVKEFKKDAKGAYPKLSISFLIKKIKDDSYGVEAKIANSQPKDMEFDAYAKMHGNAKKDIKAMLVDEIKKIQQS
jgi:hypothetical protein